MGYDNGCIYMIFSKNTKRGYIGSTIQGMNVRKHKHETDYRGYTGVNPKFRNYRSSFDIIEDGDYDIHLIENYPCNCKKELEERETAWIESFRNVMDLTNKSRPRKNVGLHILECPENIQDLIFT